MAARFDVPDGMPDGAPAALLAAADQHRRSLLVPASQDERTAVLANLRLQTITRSEHQEEARARFRLLRAAVEDVPLEVLEEACARYAQRNKFFPTAVAELLSYTRPIMEDRKRTAHRLVRLAEAAEKQEARRKELAEDPVDPAEVTALLDRLSAAAREQADAGRSRRSARMPTPEEQAQIMAEMKAIAGIPSSPPAEMLQEAAEALAEIQEIDEAMRAAAGVQRAA